MNIKCTECLSEKPVGDFTWRIRKHPDNGGRCLACRRHRTSLAADGFRVCSTCGETKRTDYFSPTTATSLNTRCKRCAAIEQKQRKHDRINSATSLTCNRCKKPKPRDAFSPFTDAVRWERRCLQCQAERQREGANTEFSKFRYARSIAKRRLSGKSLAMITHA